MAKPSRPSQEKRNRERVQKERQQEKEVLRESRKELRKTRDEMTESGIDPDLIGIFPGPQPQLED